MAVHGEVVLQQRVCRGPGCRTTFWICTHCDRGQRYCSPACRSEARRRQHRAANRRYQQSPEGRLDHRDRQQHYRERRCQPRVTDQSSLSAISPAPFGCGEKIPTPVAVALRAGLPDGWKRGPNPGCVAPSVAAQAVASILCPTFRYEGEVKPR